MVVDWDSKLRHFVVAAYHSIEETPSEVLQLGTQVSLQASTASLSPCEMKARLIDFVGIVQLVHPDIEFTVEVDGHEICFLQGLGTRSEVCSMRWR